MYGNCPPTISHSLEIPWFLLPSRPGPGTYRDAHAILLKVPGVALPQRKLHFVHSLGLGMCLQYHIPNRPFLTEKRALGVKSSVYPTKRHHASLFRLGPYNSFVVQEVHHNLNDRPYQPLLYPTLSAPSLHSLLSFLPKMTRQHLSWHSA